MAAAKPKPAARKPATKKPAAKRTPKAPADPDAPKPKRTRKPKEPTAVEKRKLERRRIEALKWRLIIAKKKQLAALKFLVEYQKRNRLEYFNGPNALVNGRFLRANPKQQMILDAWLNPKYKTFVYVGANRTGKTTLAVIIALSTVFGEWLWNKQPIYFPHKESRRVRIVSQDWESHVMKVLIPEIKKWWPEIRPYDVRKNNIGAEAFWTCKTTKSTLEIMTTHQDPMLHEGGNHDLIIYDEPLPRDHYIANARGLVDRQGRELFTMTLLRQPWIDQEVVHRTLKDENRRDTGIPDPSVFVVETQMEDNIGYGLTRRGMMDYVGKVNDDEYEARIQGIPLYKKGLVYPMFDRKIHVVERFRVPLDWPVDIALDTHPRKPHSVLFMATNPRGLKYCIAEIRMHGNGTQLADEVVRMVQWGVYRVNRVIIDPLSKGDGNDPAGSTYDKVRDVLSRYDIILETASKHKDTGILMVKEWLMSENKMASLFFFNDLVYTIKETERLMWEKPEQDDKEKAVKDQDDMTENLYRLILLETEYVPMEDEEDGEPAAVSNVNETTGY